MQTTPFWIDEAPRPDDLPVAEGVPDRCDVAVIGGGYTGLNAALALRASGADVVVLEARTTGWGASSRNGGMATSGLKTEPPTLFKRYGPLRGRAFWEWGQQAISDVEQLVIDEAIECNFERSGSVTLASKPAHFERMREDVEWFRRNLGEHDARLLSPRDLTSEIGSSVYFGGLLDNTSAALHPARYVFGLARAAARHGAILAEDAPVTTILREQGAWRLSTRRGSLVAREVLLATNGYTTQLVPRARQGIFPAGSYIICTEPLSLELQNDVSPRGRMFFDSLNFLNYFRLTPDGRMLFGGRHNLSTSLDVYESARSLRERMVEVFPQLAAAKVTHSWTGKLGLTFDLMPHIGQADGVWYAMGYCGHGVAVASKLGREAAQIIAGERASSLFREISHMRTPVTHLDRYYLPFVSAWYRMMDKVQ